MQNIFEEVNSLDKRCYEKYFLSEELLMEHASNGIKNYIYKHFIKGSSILIVCGSGNNGADGITLSRLLHKDFDVSLYLYENPKTDIGILQHKRAKALGVNEIKEIKNGYDLVVDCLFGSGLSRELQSDMVEILKQINQIEAFKIACDIPSGILYDGTLSQEVFTAHITFTMGAFKLALFADIAKDYVGKIKVVDLGISRKLYEKQSTMFLLEKKDLKLPLRDKKNIHKGNFGHLAVIAGEKEGAAILSAKAGFALGSGLVSLVNHQKLSLKAHIMQSHFIPVNTTAIALGMGLGKYDADEMKEILDFPCKKVIDADMFYTNDILQLLKDDNVVFTPHPKEFCALLNICNLACIDIKELQNNRFKYVKIFCQTYPNVVLLLKGANVIIAQNEILYVNPYGDSALSFGGSGDVLSGFIASLLAQGYTPIQGAITGSLIHTFSAKKAKKNNYALTPFDLIKGSAKL